MPTSHWLQLNEILSVVQVLRPRSVLDIGVGFGKFGVLLREYLELWDGRERYSDWKCRIDGIEAFAQYRNPIYDRVYNHVYQGDARQILTQDLPVYDLVLLVDVLEHFTRSEGQALLLDCVRHSKNILIATPHRASAQKAAFGNEFEHHRSEWGADDLSCLGERIVVDNSRSLICCSGQQLDRLFTELSGLFLVGRKR